MRRSQDKMGKAERNTFILKCAINQSINAIKIFMHTRPNYRHVPVCIRFSSEYTTHSAHRMQRSTKIIRTIRRRSAHAAASWWTMGKERARDGPHNGNRIDSVNRVKTVCAANSMKKSKWYLKRVCGRHDAWCRNGEEGCEVQIKCRVLIWCHWFIWHNQISNYYELQSVGEMKIKLCTQTDYSKLNKSV